MAEREDFQRARRRLLKAGVYLAPAILSLSDFFRHAWAQGGPPDVQAGGIRAEVPVDVPVDVRLDVPVDVRVEARITIRPR